LAASHGWTFRVHPCFDHPSVYHLSVKPISRSAGRSATAAAAYRAGEEIVDERTGEVHDYTRKGGVEHAEIVLPAGSPGWAADRAALWNAAEAAEKRKDARVAREYEVALPKELSRAQGIELMRDFAADLVERYGVAVDFAIHRDHREKWDGSEKGFDAFHAHVLTSTRQMGRDGFGEKTSPELSDAKRRSLGLGEGAKEVERTRERWEIVANRHLEMAGESQRIDRRSLKEQGIDREPTRHLGPIVTALERRGIQTDTGDVNRRIEAAYLQGVRERAELAALRPQVLDLSSSIEQALMVRDGLKVREQIEGRLREKPVAQSARPAQPPGPFGPLGPSQGDGLKPGAEGSGSGGRQDSPGRDRKSVV
jgi:ATP-dependent exoDNAse (exonuclease V) alpha subunit